ncbi:zinc finger BED domain-containing protein DAYSLEEPER-like [Malania oleifera]|uniref:zinc finger BED domain-containing protein DAYSLEEPER-like n=1 Tax=Malania oleifera TaxID=397392 RepID=UPI0025AE2A86|nr:zinc finger BED domain-containing protein DAYSLEEPER-like [Malania oleifera]
MDTINLDFDDECNITPFLDKSEKNSSSINDGTSKKRQHRKTSTTWDEFYLLPIDVDGKQKAKCKKCGAEYVANASTHGTTNLRRHINSCPLRDNYDVKQMHMDYGTKLHAKKIKQDVYCEKMTIAIIKHCYPFSWVELEGNRDVHKYLNPDVKPISRNTAKADVLKIHKREKEKLKLTLQSVFGREWGIDRKIFSITLDNAIANDSMQDILSSQLSLQAPLVSGGEYFHVRCCASILNLIVQEGLKVIERVVFNIRESVKYIKGLEGRKLKFEECIKQVGILASISLRLDVPTRWNSTFMMIESALIYRRALIHYALLVANYKYCPSNEEWNRAEVICNFLKPFYDMTKLLSGSDYPTSNLYFSNIWKIQLHLLETMENSDSIVNGMAAKMKEKFDKYWKCYSVVLAFAIVLDPRYKLQFVEFCYSKVDSSTSRKKLNLLRQKSVPKLTFGNMTLEIYVFNRTPSGCDDSEVHTLDVVDDLDTWELFSAFGLDGAFENEAPEQSKVIDEKVPLISMLLESEG